MRFVANVAGRRNDGSRCVPGDVSCRSWGRAAYFGILRDIAFAAAVLSTAGCATLFNGFSQRIDVKSEPPGAEVFVGGELAGTTPTEVVVSRRATEHEFRVVDGSGNSEYRWVRSRMSEEAWLNIFSGLFVGYGAWFRSAEDKLEGNIGVGILGFMIPWAVDLALGGMHEFPDRLDFSSRSAVRREPGAQKPVRPVQPYRRVLRGDVQPPRRLDVAPALDVVGLDPRVAVLSDPDLEAVDPPGAAGRPPVSRRLCGIVAARTPSAVPQSQREGNPLHFEDTHHGRRCGHLARSGCGSRRCGRAEQGRQGRGRHERCCCVPASGAVHGTGCDSLVDLRSHGTEPRARTAVDGDPDPAG